MLKILAAVLFLILPFYPLYGQKDTLVCDNIRGIDSRIFISKGYETDYLSDTIFNKKDSSRYTGFLKVMAYDKSGGQEKFKLLSQEHLYSVQNGICKPIYSFRYYTDLSSPNARQLLSTSFYAENAIQTISYNKNGKPWCLESGYLDSLGIGISEKTVLDSTGRFITKTQRKNGNLDGFVQTVLTSGDTLTLQYEAGHLIDVLNEKTLFFSEEDTLISENEFIDRANDWVFYWSYIVFPGDMGSKIVFYRFNPSACEISVLQEGHCLSEERRKRLTKKAN